jgi:hypothetical protein
LKLNGTLWYLVFDEDVNIYGAEAYTIQRKKKLLVVGSKEIGLALNADKIFMVMSRDQNAGRNHSMRTDSSSFARLEQFRYFGTTLMDQNSIQEEIKGRLRSGNVCYYSV